jgi:hypothetical protein
MRPAKRQPAPDERGFILVGVVMFMLALTILGLSLFALSSYEAQFFNTSAAREQSLQNAESGMELAKTLLAQSPPPQRLEDVRRAIGQFGVTNAYAYQWRSGLPDDTSSQGPVQWDSTLVLVVSGRSGNVERTLQARYIPAPAENPYKRVITSGTGLRIDTQNSISPSVLELRGGVWHPVRAAGDTAWTANVTWPQGRPVLGDTPPLPIADAFVDARLADPLTAEPWFDFDDESDLRMALRNPGPAPVRFFRNPPRSTTDDTGYSDLGEYSFFAHRDLTIRIQGTVVWVVPQGASFRDKVIVVPEGGVPSTLVIVAKRNGREPGSEDRGLWFKGGLTSADPNARVYLVSEGSIGITHRQNESSDQEVRRVNVVAGGLFELGGPDFGHRFRLFYDAAGMDALADQLMALGALPGLTGTVATTFQIARSTWAETTPR